MKTLGDDTDLALSLHADRLDVMYRLEVQVARNMGTDETASESVRLQTASSNNQCKPTTTL